jgi:hypothetical protein
MSHNSVKTIAVLTGAVVTLVVTSTLCLNAQSNFKPSIPKTWDTQSLEGFELPLANRAASPKHISAAYYYSMPVRPIYKSYPIYHPANEPNGYFESLKQKSPDVIFDESKLNTEDDWIRAGEMVFDAPVELLSEGQLFTQVRNAGWYDKTRIPITKDGIFPFMRYVVRERGKVELGIMSCAMCHSRVMADGEVIKGAQGNFPDDRAAAYETRIDAAEAKDPGKFLSDVRQFLRRNYAAPWLNPDPNAQPERMSLDEIASTLEAIVPGTCARQGSSPFFPPRIPDLIGIRERRYLDATGISEQRSIGDLMRYAALNQGADLLADYGGFRPVGQLPEPQMQSRYSDEQLYALSLYLYSLRPPRNPNNFDGLAARGQEIFKQEGCDNCHTPPLYTNNKLTPVDGFSVPDEDLLKYDILRMSVGTDPNLSLRTRRGTGYYKVPSLKGVWYRGPFEHNGSVATLEDWFDPRRLSNDYVPTGFRPVGAKRRAVVGHPFGLDLSLRDRKALIAFLKTL